VAKSVEDIYRRHIQSLTAEERMQLIALTSEGLAQGIGVEQPVRRIGELHGLGREIWRGVDAQQLVDELRREWDA
jgi:hypothetical protein